MGKAPAADSLHGEGTVGVGQNRASKAQQVGAPPACFFVVQLLSQV